jgi:kynureninase
MPRDAERIVSQVLRHEWGERLIRSWNEGWWDLQLDLGDRLAPLLGASPGEVIISDSTSVNLYKLAMAAVRARPGRTRIVTDNMNFPSDVYVLKGVAETLRAELVIVESDSADDPIGELERVIDDTTALVSLSHTTFKTGYTYDLARMTEMAHAAGALTLWDLSHSAGAMPIDLSGSKADLAVGCTYKHLNGGPGAPAFLFVRTDLQDRLDNPIPAWWGHAEPFSFDLAYEPVEGIRRFHTGTMPMLSLAAVASGISEVSAAGLPLIRAKSLELGQFLIEQWDQHLRPLGFGLASPSEPTLRGSHICLTHPDGLPISLALIDIGKVIPDFRAPDGLRLGLSALYTTYREIHTAIQRLKGIVTGGLEEGFREVRLTVT